MCPNEKRKGKRCERKKGRREALFVVVLRSSEEEGPEQKRGQSRGKKKRKKAQQHHQMADYKQRLGGILLFALLGSVLGTLSPLEQTYFTLPNGTNAREYLLTYTSTPHLAGIFSSFLVSFIFNLLLFVKFHLLIPLNNIT